MPYFVYKIEAEKKLTHLETFAKYRDAKVYTRGLRAEQQADDTHTFRLIFAKHTEEAERLLLQKREPRPLGEDA